MANDLADVKANFSDLAETWKTDFPELHAMLHHVLRGGKVLRPALTFLAGRCIDRATDSILNMATASELLHVATLVHDDAIDKADSRRGRETVSKRWGMGKAILLGDFLLSRASEFVDATHELRVVKLFSHTMRAISVAELKQARASFNLEQSLQGYMDRISGKTAALLKMSCESGAILAGGTDEQIQVLSNFGFNLGLAFQIVDDILDFTGTEAELGKPVGSDLRQGTITLPSLLLMERYSASNPISDFLRGVERDNSITKAIDMIKSDGLIEESYHHASKYSALAREMLGRLPESPYRESLWALTDYLVERKA